MKRVAAIALILLTACGSAGTEIETHNIKGMCTVEVHINNSGNPDEDYSGAIPCVIPEDTP